MLLSVLLFVNAALAAPAHPFVVHEKRAAPEHLVRRRLNKDVILPIRIALTQSNLEDGHKYLMDISDPDSENYGKHWTTDEIHAKFAPGKETVEAVKIWLEESGFSKEDTAVSSSRGWLSVDMPVHKAESLFATEYYEQEDGNGDVRVGCDVYHVPSHLSQHIDHLRPGVMISAPLRKTRSMKRSPHNRRDTESAAQSIPSISSTGTAHCGEFITPACLRAMYGIPDAEYNQTENVLGVFEAGDLYDQIDLDLFFSNYAPWVPNGTHPNLVSINDAKGIAPFNSSEVTGESLVDFDLAFSLLYPQSVIQYQTQPTTKQAKVTLKETGNVNVAASVLGLEPFLDALDGAFCTESDREDGADCGTIELTRVLSMSYGWNELFLPEAFAKRACAEFMKLALKGHTIVVSSGDYGPAGHNQLVSGLSEVPSNGCFSPKHPYSYHYNGTIFNPAFPASCPWVTTVGGTQLDRKNTAGDPERVMYVHDQSFYPEVYTFSSSGGVSNYFGMPEYQKCAVDEYFRNHDPGYPTYEYSGIDSLGSNGGVYSQSGRAFPDVAANGAHLVNFADGEFYPGGEAGTSLATPIFASLITMINQQRTLAGKSPVGFINPVVYKHPEVFNDITMGSAPGCHTNGFSAVEGWDPTTGLGTPNYPKLLEVFMNLP